MSSSEDLSSSVSPSGDSVTSPTVSYSCAICSRPCTKYLYYGARACLGCRAFFRRARAANRFEKFVCVAGDEGCDVNSQGSADNSDQGAEKRKVCPYCRHKRCLEVGMNPAWMLSDEDREERRRRRKKTTTTTNGSNSARSSSSCQQVYTLPSTPPNIVFTAEELLQLQRIVSTTNDIYLDAFTSNMLVYRITSRTIFNMSVYGTKPGTAFIEGLEKFKWGTIQTLCERFQDFSPINPVDRRSLLEKNFPVLFTLLVANYFHPEGFRVLLSRTLERLKKRQSENELFERMASNLEVLEVSEVPLTLNYDQVFVSPWLPNPDEEVRHAQIFDKIRLWGRGAPDKIRDQAMMILLYLILILDPAGCDNLKSSAVVDMVHNRYVTLLCRYLRWNYGNEAARKWLGGGVAIVTLAKEAQHIMEQRLRMVASKDMVTGEAIEYVQGPHTNCCCFGCYQSYNP